MAKFKCHCVICGNLIGYFYPSLIRKTCGKECKSKITSINNMGINNPNYRHGRNIENNCIKCSRVIDGRSTYCTICRGKYVQNPFLGKGHSIKSKKIIGEKSSKKFTKEYLERVRKTYEKRGLWIPLEDLPKYIIYYRKCEWDREIQKASNFFLVRDHMYSRYDGFKNNIDPLILKHPVNLKILSRGDNISKGSKSSITLHELYSKIRKYKGIWSKHIECLKLIREVL